MESSRSLPANVETSLRLLERGYYLCNGGAVPPVSLPEKVFEFCRGQNVTSRAVPTSTWTVSLSPA
jgi:hypothetical protein